MQKKIHHAYDLAWPTPRYCYNVAISINRPSKHDLFLLPAGVVVVSIVIRKVARPKQWASRRWLATIFVVSWGGLLRTLNVAWHCIPLRHQSLQSTSLMSIFEYDSCFSLVLDTWHEIKCFLFMVKHWKYPHRNFQQFKTNVASHLTRHATFRAWSPTITTHAPSIGGPLGSR